MPFARRGQRHFCLQTRVPAAAMAPQQGLQHFPRHFLARRLYTRLELYSQSRPCVCEEAAKVLWLLIAALEAGERGHLMAALMLGTWKGAPIDPEVQVSSSSCLATGAESLPSGHRAFLSRASHFRSCASASLQSLRPGASLACGLLLA